MNRYMLLIAAMMCWALQGGATGAVISRDWKTPGDGLLTYDDVNQREWLDLTESRLAMFPGTTFEQRYQNALLEIQPGGVLEGFVVARTPDLRELTVSAGINPAASFTANEGPTGKLIDLLGSSFLSPVLPANRASFGLLDELSMAPSGKRLMGVLIRHQEPGIVGTAGLLLVTGVDGAENPNNTGIWLFRPVPEPSSLLGSILSVWGVHRRNRRAQRRRSLRSRTLERLPRQSRLEVLEHRRLLTSADIVFVVDESFSNALDQDPTHAWLMNSVVPRLEVAATTFQDSLQAKGITDIKYGLIGFAGPGANSGQQANEHAYSIVIDASASPLAAKLAGNNSQLVTAMSNL